MDASSPEVTPPPARGLLLWAAILAGPSLWFANQQANYLLVYWACRHGTLYLLHGVTLACAVAVGAIALRCRGEWRTAQARVAAGGPEWRRLEFLAWLGAVMGAFFVVAIIALGLPALFLNPCHR